MTLRLLAIAPSLAGSIVRLSSISLLLSAGLAPSAFAIARVEQQSPLTIPRHDIFRSPDEFHQPEADPAQLEKALALAKIAGKYGAIGETEKATTILTTAYELVAPLPNTNGKTNVLFEIIRQSGAIADNDRALEAARAIPDTEMSLISLRNLAIRYAKAGQPEKAHSLLTDVYQLTNRLPDGTIGKKRFGKHTIPADDQGGERSFWLPVVVSGYAAIGQFEQAFHITKTIKGKQQQARALSEISLRYAEIGQFDQALQLLDRIESPLVKVDALRNIASQARNQKQPERAVALLQSAVVSLRTSGDRPEVITSLLKLANDLSQLQQGTTAVAVLDQVVQLTAGHTDDRRAQLLAEAIRQYLAIEQVERAVQATAGIANNYLKARLLTEIAAYYNTKKQPQTARAMLVKALQASKAMTQTSPDSTATASSLLVNCNPPAPVICEPSELWDCQLLLQATTVATIASTYTQLGQSDQAKELLAHAFHIADSVPGYSALNGASLPDDTAMQPSARPCALTQVAMQYARAGLSEQALAMVPAGADAAQVRTAIALTAIAASQYSDATTMAKPLVNKQEILKALLDQVATVKQPDIAQIILSQALQLAESETSDAAKATAIADVAVSYAALGEQQQATQLLATALQIATDLDNSKGGTQ